MAEFRLGTNGKAHSHVLSTVHHVGAVDIVGLDTEGKSCSVTTEGERPMREACDYSTLLGELPVYKRNCVCDSISTAIAGINMQACTSAESSSCSLQPQDHAVMMAINGADPGDDQLPHIIVQEYRDTGGDIADNDDDNHLHIIDHEGMNVCSMCGDVGISKHLFMCIRCSHRYQHTYCSRSYPHNVVSVCDWCLCEEELVIKHSSGHMIVKDASSPSSDYALQSSNIKVTEKCMVRNHSKAFEYLLQIAEVFNAGAQTVHNRNETGESQQDYMQPGDLKDRVMIRSSSNIPAHAVDDNGLDCNVFTGHIPKRQRCSKAILAERSSPKGQAQNSSLGVNLNSKWRALSNKRNHHHHHIHSTLHSISSQATKGMGNRRYKLLADVLC